jgi:peptidoglycan/xylan/chitin deacetylase (PgdA/CDA1 family)
VVTQLAVQNPELAPRLRAAGEIGSHSADHRQIAGRRWGTQLTGMWKARSDIAEWSGVPPLGLRPPRELYDRSTLEAWGRLGGLYLAASNDARSAAPEIFTVRSGPVVVLPRVVDDDYTVMVTRGKNSSAALQSELEASLQKIRSLGGLHLLTLHSQLINNNRRIDAVEAVVDAAAAVGDVWIARAGDVAEWWLDRSQLELRVEERTDRSAVLTIANHGDQTVTSVWIHVYLPEARETYAAPEIGETILESRFGHWGLRVQVPPLEPNSSLRILLPRLSADAEPQSSISVRNAG